MLFSVVYFILRLYLHARIPDPKIRHLREDFYDASIYLAMPTTGARESATRLRDCVEATLDRIGDLIGGDLNLIQDRPIRPAAPER